MTRRVLWIGCGRHAEQMLLPQFLRQDVEIAAFCDINEAAAAALARRYGVARVDLDFRSAIASLPVDLVAVAAGPAVHRDVALAALERGLPVFMEKPCGATAADARLIAEAAEKAGRLVGVGFMKRFATVNRIAHNVVSAPDFGPVAGMTAEYMTAPGYFKAGEVVDYTSFYLHHCVHYMDLMPWLAGAAVESVTVFRAEPSPGKLLLHVHFAFAGGAIGTLVMGTLQSRGTPMERLQVMGDHRRVEADGVTTVSYFRNPPFKSDDPAATLADGVDTLTWRPNLTAAANEDFKGYHAMFTAFFAALDGQATEMATIADGVRAMAVLEAMIAGIARPGIPVPVRPVPVTRDPPG
jgi:myo-inositol 2-dehydrogenase/D-chiro-inositol 1-dehydrogenase